MAPLCTLKIFSQKLKENRQGRQYTGKNKIIQDLISLGKYQIQTGRIFLLTKLPRVTAVR